MSQTEHRSAVIEIEGLQLVVTYFITQDDNTAYRDTELVVVVTPKGEDITAMVESFPDLKGHITAEVNFYDTFKR